MCCEICKKLTKGWESVELNNIENGLKNSSLRKPGVYFLWVEKRGVSLKTIQKDDKVDKLVCKIKKAWKHAGEAIEKDLKRLKEMKKDCSDCNIIYLGRAGERKGKGVLGRILDFPGGHTGWASLLTLLYYGWEIKCFYRSCDPSEVKESEKEWMKKFCQWHWNDGKRKGDNWKGKCHKHGEDLRPVLNRQCLGCERFSL